MRQLISIPVIALLVLSMFSAAFAGDPARIGTAAGEQLLIPVGARDLAVGGSNIAYSNGLDAMYWNPAGLSKMENTAMGTFSTMSIFNTIDVNYLGLAFNVGRLGTLGFSLKVLDFGDVPLTTNQDMDGETGATFSPSFLTAAVTYSRRLSDNVQVGVNGK
ncbi:MAG: hypothetical protein KDE52_01950, partial [Calditrichaeota bacterium]|nr:hypothetical protein [Calditrichota bacterium]